MQRKNNYNVADSICVDCLEDEELRREIASRDSPASCAICGQDNQAVTIEELAALLDPILREHFRHGRFIRRYGDGDDDGYWEEQQGEDLSSVIQEVLGQYLDCEEAVKQALMEADPADPRDGEDPFYDDMVSYEEIPTSIRGLVQEWDAIGDELKTSRRFFSDRARKFFDWLFEGIEALSVYTPIVDQSQEQKVGVVQEWASGIRVFRCRRADSVDEYSRFLLAQEIELGPPPSRYARAGRMNPDGIAVFYGAVDEQTCLAEMRPSIGGYVVIGCFETARPLRLLDFHALDRAYGDGGGLSYFDPSFREKAGRHKFRRGLHRLISQPVLSGHDEEYLITQVLAEYLAHVRAEPFDGLLFGSTQYRGGVNVVLFPRDRVENALGRFAIRFVAGSGELHQTETILYGFRKVGFHVVRGVVHRDDYDHDHEEEDDY